MKIGLKTLCFQAFCMSDTVSFMRCICLFHEMYSSLLNTMVYSSEIYRSCL